MIISGELIDEKTKKPIPFANIYVKDNVTVGVASDEYGLFKLDSSKIKPETEIDIWHIGYEKKIIKANILTDSYSVLLSKKNYTKKEVEIHECKKGKVRIFGKCVNKYIVLGCSFLTIGITATLIMAKTKKWL